MTIWKNTIYNKEHIINNFIKDLTNDFLKRIFLL